MSPIHKKILILAGLSILTLSVYAYTLSDNGNPVEADAQQRCPDDYPNTDAGSAAHVADTNIWTNKFFDAHPGATLTDWSAARYQFWIENNCVEALERYWKAKNYTNKNII